MQQFLISILIVVQCKGPLHTPSLSDVLALCGHFCRMQFRNPMALLLVFLQDCQGDLFRLLFPPRENQASYISFHMTEMPVLGKEWS